VYTHESLKRFTDYGSQCLDAFYMANFDGKIGSDFIRTEVPLEAQVEGVPL